MVAHGNSLRGIIKNLKGISDEAISEFNLPTAVPYVFEFDEGLGCVKDYFLGDPAEIASLMEAVANQGRRGCPPPSLPVCETPVSEAVVCRSVFDPVLCLGRRTGFACRRSSPDRK